MLFSLPILAGLVRAVFLIARPPEFGGYGRFRETATIALMYAGASYLLLLAGLLLHGLSKRLRGKIPVPLRLRAWGAGLGWVLATLLVVILNRDVPFPREAAVREGSASTGPGNLILISLDTVRRGHLGLYGYRRPTTPFLDGLAPEMNIYERAIATSPWTLPSHASMFTGLLPGEHRAVHTNKHLDSDRTTAAEILKSRGYHTLGIGAGPYLTASFGIAQGFTLWDDHVPGSYSWDVDLISKLFPGLIAPVGKRRADQVLELLMRQYGSFLEPPFFLFLNFYDAHNRYTAPLSYSWRFRHWKGGRAWYGINESRLFQAVNEGRELLAEGQRRTILAQYDANIRYLDDHLAILWRWLDETGRLDRTTVILVGDHGESFGEGGMLGHGLSLHGSQIDVPLMVWRGRGAGGRRITSPVDTRQVFDLLTAEEPGGNAPFPGTPTAEVVPNLDSYVGRIPRFAFSKRAIIEGCYKILDGEDRKVHVYNLCKDPSEKREVLAGSGEWRQQNLDHAVGRLGDRGSLDELGGRQDSSTIEAPLEEKLRSLGYIN